jgi:myosin heavy chain 6/7
MYGVPFEEFLKALLKPRVKVGTEWVNKGQNLEQVINRVRYQPSNPKHL